MPDNPVKDFFDFQSKESAARAEKDLVDWGKWHEGGRKPEDLKPLIKRYRPLINRKVTEWKAPNVSPAAFRGELQKQFVQAAHKFDPNRGVAFNTYMQSRLQKAKRFNIRHQNVGYIPEGQVKHIGSIESAQNELFEQLGRKPKTQEIAKHIGLPQRQVATIMRGLRKDVPASMFETDPLGTAASQEQEVIRLVQKRPEEYLTVDEAKIFSRIYGPGGAARKRVSGKALSKEFGMNESQVSRLKTSIGRKLKAHLKP